MYDERSHPGHDPREPLFGYGRSFARDAVWLAWAGLIGVLACLTWQYPVSPAPVLLGWAAVLTFGGIGND